MSERALGREPAVRGQLRLYVIILCLLIATTSLAEDVEPAAGGRLAWVFSNDLDMIGEMWVDLPYAIDERDSFYFRLDTLTSIEKADSDFTFGLRELDYTIETGMRRLSPGGSRWGAFVGQRGDERVDEPGQAYIRYVGGEWRSGLSGKNRRWSGSVGAAAVLDDREVEGDLVLRYDLAYNRTGERFDWGIDLSFDGLFDLDDVGFDADVEIGPRMSFPFPGGRKADLFVHYLRSRNPLGLDIDAVLAGFDLSESGPGGRSDGPGPDVHGSIEAGGGEDRLAGRFRLVFLTPELFAGFHGVVDLDANILTAEDTGELYYFYHVGLERSFDRFRTGGYFYHRSNHALAEPNDTITNINVLEGGIESPHWGRLPADGKVNGWDRLDYRLRGGLLLDSTFGEDRDWHLRAGCRYLLPVKVGSAHLFLQAEFEGGDVSRQAYSAGMLDRSGLSVRAEYREDDQYYGVDRTALVFLAGYRF